MPFALMGMTDELQRKVKAILFIAMLASADVRVQQAARFGYAAEQPMEASAVQELIRASAPEPAKQIVKQMNAMLADPSILRQAKRVVEQMEAMVAIPSLQEQVRGFTEQIKASPELNFQEQSNLFVQSMETLHADPNFQAQAERINGQMQAILADPEFQKQGDRAADQLEAAMVGSSLQQPSLQENTDSLVDTMLDKILARPLEISHFDSADMDSAMLGKSPVRAVEPRRLAAQVQPRTGSQSALAPLSIRTSSAARFGLPAPRSAVTTSAAKAKGTKKSLGELRREQALEKGILDLLVPDIPEGLLEKGLNYEISAETQEFLSEAAFLFARLTAASVMLHHGQEKIASESLFTTFVVKGKYFKFLPGPASFWTYAVGAVEVIAPIFLAAGVFSRAAAVSLSGTVLAAAYYSLKSTGTEGFPLSKFADKVPIFHNYGFETPGLYLAIFVLVAARGPGKFSAAQVLGFNDDKSPLGKLKQ